MSNIKLGVTLYCFTYEYATGKLDLEGCIRTAKQIGAEGYEIVATQMIPSYPYVSDKFLGEIKAISAQYGVEPICYAANMDRGMRHDRNLTEDEMLAMAVNDLKSANKLGCKVVREQFLMSPQAMVRLAPYAEEYGIKVGIEIHNPELPTSPIMQQYLEAFEKSGSKYVGFVPDFGCFAVKPNKPHWDQALKNGARLEMIEKAAQLRYDKVPLQAAQKVMLDAGATGAEMGAFSGMYGFVTFYHEPDLEGLKKIMPYCFHMHGKFHYMYEDLREHSIPYEKILPVIAASDFDGYIMTEYEDHISGNAVEQCRRQLAMERKILGIGV